MWPQKQENSNGSSYGNWKPEVFCKKTSPGWQTLQVLCSHLGSNLPNQLALEKFNPFHLREVIVTKVKGKFQWELKWPLETRVVERLPWSAPANNSGFQLPFGGKGGKSNLMDEIRPAPMALAQHNLKIPKIPLDSQTVTGNQSC